jgi:hypothetical protein
MTFDVSTEAVGLFRKASICMLVVFCPLLKSFFFAVIKFPIDRYVSPSRDFISGESRVVGLDFFPFGDNHLNTGSGVF